VRGAAGNVRSTNTVHLEEADDGSTRVRLEGDVALGGMLGSVGQKVVAKQASKVTRSFAEALQLELSGGAASAPDPGSADGETVSPPPAASEPAAASLPRPALAEPVLPVPHAGPRLPGATVRTVTAGALVLAVAAFALRRLRGR
jgi:hypothetical protein